MIKLWAGEIVGCVATTAAVALKGQALQTDASAREGLSRMTSEADELRERATRLAVEARWYLELDWSCQGRSGTIRVDDPGGPFGTTAIEGMPHYWYGRNDVGAHAWVPYAG
ncbi:hypothetical protein ACWDBO_53135 [Streptomyces mirabilis]|uniref:hypothetical protein n=1 Tax=Streptomyces TaxID=1883 RepID=UPI0039F48CC0